MTSNNITLFCIPFAGGSSYAFRDLSDHLPEFITLEALEYPGHGLRYNEPLLSDMTEIVRDLFSQIQNKINQPYAILGHSLGAAVSYLLVKEIAAKGLRQADHFFVSGRNAPSCSTKKMLSSETAQIDVRTFLMNYDGTPAEVLENEELLELFEPLLIADISVLDSYEYRETAPLNVPITVMIGRDDSSTTMNGAELWSHETTRPVRIERLEGGHFFLFSSVRDVCRIIETDLAGITI